MVVFRAFGRREIVLRGNLVDAVNSVVIVMMGPGGLQALKIGRSGPVGRIRVSLNYCGLGAYLIRCGLHLLYIDRNGKRASGMEVMNVRNLSSW
ncbi:unnamed protein product [Calypogeia fissa]